MTKRDCFFPGCPKLIEADPYNYYCEEHKPPERKRKPSLTEADRPSASKRGYDRKWRAYRRAFLRRNPLCRDPFDRHEGKPVPATIVDHIKPHEGNKRLFWDPANLQALCRSCHGVKTYYESEYKKRERKTNGEK